MVTAVPTQIGIKFLVVVAPTITVVMEAAVELFAGAADQPTASRATTTVGIVTPTTIRLCSVLQRVTESAQRAAVAARVDSIYLRRAMNTPTGNVHTAEVAVRADNMNQQHVVDTTTGPAHRAAVPVRADSIYLRPAVDRATGSAHRAEVAARANNMNQRPAMV